MKLKRSMSIILALIILASFTVSCQKSTPPATTEPGESVTPEPDTDTDTPPEDAEAEVDREFYEFTYYFSNTSRDVSRIWGEDAISKEWGERFNIKVNLARADADPEARLNTMVAAGELPDVVFMNRNADWRTIVDLGQFVALDDYIAKYPGFRNYVGESTKNLLAVNGKQYTIPQWSSNTGILVGGGNNAFMYNKKLYEGVGSPEIKTLEDVYNYAVSLKGADKNGSSVVPVMFENKDRLNALIRGSYGAFTVDMNENFTVINDQIRYLYNDEKIVEALVYANRLWRAGVMNQEVLTETLESQAEKVSAGRVGMYIGQFPGMMHVYYGARNLLRESDPGDDYIMIDLPVTGDMKPEDIYGEKIISTGGDCISISTNAEKPERIFEWLDYMLTPEAAIEQIFAPKGYMWDELDENGLPKLFKFEAEMDEDERRSMGIWGWNIPGQTDHINQLKYAVNELLPADKQDWVALQQGRYLAWHMWVADEFIGLDLLIDNASPEGINRTTIQENTDRGFADALMAKSEEECRQIIQSMIDFAERNGVTAIEEAYTKGWKDNLEVTGVSFIK